MMNSDSENDESCRPLESAKITSLDSLHEKSRKKYESVYQSFINWQSFMGINTFTESVLLVYFEELAVKYKSPSLWAHYSMLKSTLNINKNINIESYLALRAFLKKKSQGYQAKKAKTFTPFEINKFITEAPDHRYLATKVALIMGIMGACRAKELHNMTIKDVQDLGSAILVTVPNIKSKTIRKFTITDHFYNICKKYIDLRPTTPAPASFFLNYQKGKCTIQKIGINKFGAMGKQIATFLKLPNPEKYTGHTFRKSSATLVVGAAGGYITAFKRHGIWNPPSETEEQIDNENNELDNDMATCGAFGCKHNNLRDTCNFFRLPTDPKLRTDWLKSLRRDLESIPKVLFICSCHFRDGKVENGPELFTFKDIIGATLQPSTSVSKMNREDVRTQVLELISQKDKIETEIKEQTNILARNGVGMSDPLVDPEGYPLNNIDIYQIRNARHRIICLQNDHKKIMKDIEDGLQGYYATTSMDFSPNQSVPMDMTSIKQGIHRTPFAKITIVSDNSPAYYADFQVNDELVDFGSVNASNFKNITDIATVVQHSEGNPLIVRLKRGDRFIVVQLTPRKWTGRGLLGCNIVAI